MDKIKVKEDWLADLFGNAKLYKYLKKRRTTATTTY